MDINFFLTILIGSLIGFLISFTGVGGGVLMVPVLTLVFRMEVSMAVGTASIFVTLTKIYATFQHIKLKTIDYRLTLFFLMGAIPGVLAAAGYVNYFLSQNLTDEENRAIQAFLKQIVVTSIFLSAALILLEKFSVFGQIKEKINQSQENFLLIFFGLITGLIMGTTGIGGGVLIFPIFYLFTRLEVKHIVGSSIFIALVISGVTALLYSKGGQVDYPSALLLVLGSLVGVYVAGKSIKKVSNRSLDWLIISLIIMSAFIMIFSK